MPPKLDLFCNPTPQLPCSTECNSHGLKIHPKTHCQPWSFQTPKKSRLLETGNDLKLGIFPIGNWGIFQPVMLTFPWMTSPRSSKVKPHESVGRNSTSVVPKWAPRGMLLIRWIPWTHPGTTWWCCDGWWVSGSWFRSPKTNSWRDTQNDGVLESRWTKRLKKRWPCLKLWLDF